MGEPGTRGGAWWLVPPLLLLGAGAFQCRGCAFPSFLSPVAVSTDPGRPLTVHPERIRYTPRSSRGDPTPAPVEMWKPLESRPELSPDGTLRVPFSGFTLIPKAGAVWVLDQGFQAYGSARFFFAATRDEGHPERAGVNLGLEVGGNLHNAFLGVDVRDPILNLLTTSVGAAFPWGRPAEITFYVGQSASLAL